MATVTALRTVSHYELLSKIAEGGMGVVYKARDVRLDRLVALKFLSPDLSASQEQIDRLFQEARSISKLNHPNIATIFEIDEFAQEPFLAFEYLPGGTLREKVRGAGSREKGLPLKQLVKYALGIARALAHAHRHGIVHRDVKSDNILLTEEDTVKLMDFGVAQVAGAESASPSDLTVGTAAYMSPEQAQGLPADHRSDIFSFGVVLYEMITGQVPFSGVAQAVVLYEVVHSEPAAVNEIRNGLPGLLAGIVEKALQKKPDDRYAAMDDVVADLEELRQELEGEDTKKSKAFVTVPAVAVLPFVDMSPERDQEYFCDGMTEEIINALTAVKGLKVVSRTSSFRYKGEAYDIREIGKKLGVQTVVEGSVRKAENRLRITAQLIEVSDGYHLWSQRYDREMTDVFEVQDEISQAIVNHLSAQLLGDRAKQLVKSRTKNLEAYNLYLKGRYFLNQRTTESITHSIECFQQALCEDCDYALPNAGLAEAYVLLAVGYGNSNPLEALGKAREAALKAIESDEDCAEAHLALALVLYRADWNWKRAEQEFRRAIDINDGYVTGHHQYAMFLAAMKRLDKALAEIRRAHELDPLSLIINTAYGRILHFSRRFEKAIAQAQRTLELDPRFGLAHFDIGVAYAQTGRYTEALEAFERSAELLENDVRAITTKAVVYGLMGEHKKARDLSRKLDELAQKQYVPAFSRAVCRICLGESDEVFALLEQAYEQRDATLVYIQVEPAFDPIRADPRYKAFVKEKMRFPG